MTFGYDEYRLREINQLLSLLPMDSPDRETLINERDKILHEIRNKESLPTSIN